MVEVRVKYLEKHKKASHFLKTSLKMLTDVMTVIFLSVLALCCLKILCDFSKSINCTLQLIPLHEFTEQSLELKIQTDMIVKKNNGKLIKPKTEKTE